MQNLFSLLPLLALSALAGVRLFLPFFVVGLLAHAHGAGLCTVPPALSPLGHPAVLIVAGLLALLEFGIDKIAWVDTLWDGLSTFTRPIGGAALGLLCAWAGGDAAMLLCTVFGGALALVVHAAKASSRASLHAAGPAGSTAVVSLAEDLFVVAGVIAVLGHPMLALVWVVIVAGAGLVEAATVVRELRAAGRRLMGRVPLERGPV